METSRSFVNMVDLDSYSDKAMQIIKDCERISDYMIYHRCSLRKAAQELCIAKSTIHRYINTYIRHYYDDEYIQLKNILKQNKSSKY